MTTPPRKPMDIDEKRMTFVATTLLILINLALLVISAITRDIAPAIAAFVIDGALALIGAVIWLSIKLYPKPEDDQ